MKNLGDYHNFYLETDVLMLCNVSETFKTTCLEHYTLNPTHFFTSPRLTWQTCLKKTRVAALDQVLKHELVLNRS